ncbi:SEC-C metal-binding domain-containing protein [uncultured Psychrobacter sp.]|uniref:SEC-C metal-binding domain-containing protein n=1 Tax=uncultured Psychrobacter sp. TaxID=259303 RepID=UPI00345AB11C
MKVPAICDNCDSIFPSLFNFHNSNNISFTGCQAEPCPNCGGIGHIPDGVYNFIGDTIELLSGPQRSINELEKLASILEHAKNNKATPQTIAEEIDKAIPELSSIKDLLPKTRSELYGFITILLTILTLIMNQAQSSNSSKIEIDTIINNIYLQTSEAQKPHNSKTVNTRKIGRNELCPCGSDKKFKKCCLP